MSNNMQEKNYLCRTFGTFGFRRALRPRGSSLMMYKKKNEKPKRETGICYGFTLRAGPARLVE
tara:strand:- start:247 stop:435 length:189 start_codon:yes stop_codon:yes gene_type:complete